MPDHPSDSRFRTTHWSLVTQVQGAKEDARRALSELLALYWEPLFAYLRRSGHPRDAAEDLVQGFMCWLLEHDTLKTIEASPERGRFRGFLLSALRFYVAREREQARARKRGGGAIVFSLTSEDFAKAESPASAPWTEQDSPESAYLRAWARKQIDAAFSKLRSEFESRGRLRTFDAIAPFLEGDPSTGAYAGIAAELKSTEGAVKVAVHRLRVRYREVLREEVAMTLEDESELEEEISTLLAAFQTQGRSNVPERPSKSE